MLSHTSETKTETVVSIMTQIDRNECIFVPMTFMVDDHFLKPRK